MKYIENMGGIWKISDRSFKKLCDALARRSAVNLDDYGKMIAVNPVKLDDLETYIMEGGDEDR